MPAKHVGNSSRVVISMLFQWQLLQTSSSKLQRKSLRRIRFAIHVIHGRINFIEMEKKPPCDDTHSLQHTEGHIYYTRHTVMCKLHNTHT